LKEAQIEYSLSIDAGTDPSETVTRSVKKEKVSSIEVEYMDGANDSPYIKSAAQKLMKLLKVGGSVMVVRS
jgi:hypothetical protein